MNTNRTVDSIKYRVIEKSGTYVETVNKCFLDLSDDQKTKKELIEKGHIGARCANCTLPKKVYRPRFIVQKHIPLDLLEKSGSLMYNISSLVYEDLKEFTNLYEAKRYVYELELDEGIIRS